MKKPVVIIVPVLPGTAPLHGRLAMSNLVFPSEPYDKMEVKGGKTIIYSITQ